MDEWKTDTTALAVRTRHETRVIFLVEFLPVLILCIYSLLLRT
jgi:hypothetical protein